MQGINQISEETLREYLDEMHRLGKTEVPFYSFDFSNRALNIAMEHVNLYNNHEAYTRIRTLCDVYYAVEHWLETGFDGLTEWVHLDRYLSETKIRNEGFLNLLRYVERAYHLPDAMLADCSRTWEAYMIGIAICHYGTPRIRSKVQAKLYSRSAYQEHRALARMYLAKNDNGLRRFKQIAA